VVNSNNPNSNQNDKDQFFHPQSKYYGEFSPEALAFNANLQEFASRVGIVCNLETGGKISSEEAYTEIKRLWKQLKQSKHELLDTPRPPSPDLPTDE
jgi:sigma54-dependent transcription regulator